MSATEIVAGVLLAIGVAGLALTSIGLLVSDDVYDELHYLAPGSLIASVAIPAAVVLHGGLTQAGAKAIVIGILLLVSNPVLSHATARAARIQRKQQLPERPDEAMERAEEEQ